MANKILRLPDVKEATGLSRSSIYMAVSQGKFPKPIKLGLRSVGWLGEEIEEWVRQKVELSRHDRRSRCRSTSRSSCGAGQMVGEMSVAPGS
jgi:prophage regulatory protein